MGYKPLVAYENWAIAEMGSTFAASPVNADFPASNLGARPPQRQCVLESVAGVFDVTMPYAGLEIGLAALALADFADAVEVTVAGYTDSARTALAYGPEDMTDRGDGKLWWHVLASSQEARYWRFAVTPIALTPDPEEALLPTDGGPEGLSAVGEIFLGPVVELDRALDYSGWRRTRSVKAVTQETPAGAMWDYQLGGPAHSFQVAWSDGSETLRGQIEALQNFVGTGKPFFFAPRGADSVEAYYVRMGPSVDLSSVPVNNDDISITLREEIPPVEV